MKKERSSSAAYITVFIALIMILSVVGFLWIGSGQSQHKYGKLSFSNQNGEWSARVGQKLLTFKYLPEDVLNISAPSGVASVISGAGMVYIAYDPSETDQEMPLSQYNLGQNLGTSQRFVVNALTSANDNGLPVITCANATRFVPVIIIKSSETSNAIILNSSCITLEGRPLLLADRLVYSAYGII